MNRNGEEYRNQILRRADWRYLLENPWPEKSICFSGGGLAEAVQSISNQNIPVNNFIPDQCDLAVAANPNTHIIREAWRALSPGGSFYTEWYSPLVGGISGIRRRLVAANFSNLVFYWPWPIPALSPALFWLPLEAKHAIRYFLSNRPLPSNPLERLISRLRQNLWRLGRSTGMLLPICVTAQKIYLPVKTATLPEDEKDKFNNDEGLESEALSYQADKLMWTGGYRSINKVIVYLFSSNNDAPRAIVKYPRTPETVPAIVHEAHLLNSLHGTNSKAASGAPAVIFLRESDGRVALGETAITGQPLYTILNHNNAPELARQVTNWLAGLVKAEVLLPRGCWWDRLVEPALDDFEQAFGTVMDKSVISKCRAILSNLDELPQTFEHRDCSPWNVLITPTGNLALLDWESAEEEGLPVLDLTYFLTYLAFFLDEAKNTENSIESYRRASDPTTLTGKLRDACQQRYLDLTGLNPVILHALRLLTWLIHARSDVRHLSADSGGVPSPASLGQSLFYNLALEELASDHVLAQGAI